MAVPDFQSFMLPTLQLTSDGNNHSLAELRDRLAGYMHLSDVDLEEKIPSGVQTKYTNRVYWSTVYLAKAGVLERVRRGVVAITTRGRELLAENHPKITIKLLDRFPEFVEFHKGDTSGSKSVQPESPEKLEESETPEEKLESSFAALQSALAGELLMKSRSARQSFSRNSSLSCSSPWAMADRSRPRVGLSESRATTALTG